MTQSRGGAKAAKRAPKANTVRKKGRTKADAAVAAGKDTPTVARAKLHKRDMDIYNSWCHGIDYTTLAERHGISPRSVARICDELRAAAWTAMDLEHPLAGIAIIDRDLTQLESAISFAAQVAEAAFTDHNWPAAIGASKHVAELRKQRLEIQQDRGIVPKKLSNLHEQWDSLQLVDAIIGIFERFDVPDEASDALAQLVQLRARRGREGRLELVRADTETTGSVSGEVVD